MTPQPNRQVAKVSDVLAEAGRRLQWLSPWGEDEQVERWREVLRELYDAAPKPPGFNANTPAYVAALARAKEALDA